ncbi:MAG: thioredoxin [Clostridia bacterium]|nr:thioredoxin [Clostridia bacterium]
MMVYQVNESNFESEVLQSPVPVLVDFNATWCGPCRMLKPVLEQLAEERPDVKVVSVDVDEAPELAEEYDVSSIPCVVLMKNGQEADRSVGFMPKDGLLALIGG